jgi:hypothetical protein
MSLGRLIIDVGSPIGTVDTRRNPTGSTELRTFAHLDARWVSAVYSARRSVTGHRSFYGHGDWLEKRPVSYA